MVVETGLRLRYGSGGRDDALFVTRMRVLDDAMRAWVEPLLLPEKGLLAIQGVSRLAGVAALRQRRYSHCPSIASIWD